jgi:hypothetical protein
MLSQWTADSWWLWVVGAGVVVCLLIRRLVFGVLIFGLIVFVSWFLDLPNLVGLHL